MATGPKRLFSKQQAFGKTSGLFAHKRKLAQIYLLGNANIRSRNKTMKL